MGGDQGQLTHRLVGRWPRSGIGPWSDRDGDAHVALFRTSDATWYLQGWLATEWAAPGDIPVVVPAHLRPICGV